MTESPHGITVNINEKRLSRSLDKILPCSCYKREIEDKGCSVVALCKCQQSKNFPLCDTTCSKFNEETNSNVGPVLLHIHNEKGASNRKSRRSSTSSDSTTKDVATQTVPIIVTSPSSFAGASPSNPQSSDASEPQKVKEMPKQIDKRKIKAIFSEDEVSKHCTEDDCWMIIHGGVYDITTYFSYHPGGKRALLKFAGKDGTENVQFHSSKMMYLLDNYFYIGRLDSAPESKCVIS